MIEAAIPSNITAEKSLLGALLMEGSLVHEALQYVRVEDLFLDSHRRIFASMCELGREGRPIDLVTLTDVLQRKRELESVGGVSYISSLVDGVPPTPSVAEYGKIVRDEARLRGLIHVANGVVARAMDGDGPDELLGALQAQVSELVGRGSRRGAPVLTEVGMEFLNEVHAIRRMDRDRTIGLTTSIPTLDRITTGIRRNELWVIGARPAVGKSALARQIAVANAKQGRKVIVFTLEMTAKQVLGAAVALHGEGVIPYYKLRDPRDLSQEELAMVQEWTAELCKLPLVLDETGGLNVAELMARARLHAAQGADLFIVDYLQRVRGEARQSNLERVAAASNAVCELAKSTGIPVVALSQLRKAPNGQEDREPTADDLKETGEILQDAATVILLHRPVESPGEINPRQRRARLSVPKQRFGDSDVSMNLVFNKRTLSFEEQA